MPAPYPYKTERTDLFVGVESEQKSEADPARYPGYLPDSQELCDPDVEWIDQRVVGHGRDPFRYIEGPKAFEGGSWTVTPYDGWPVAFAFGEETATDGGSEMTAKLEGPPPTCTVEGNFYGNTGPDFSRALMGVAADSATIEVNNEEMLQVTLSTMGLGLSDDTLDGSRAPTTGISLPEREVWSFKKVQSNLTLFGTEFARVEDFSLEINNNLTAERYLESSEAPDGEPYEMMYGNVEYSIDLEIAITDRSLYDELVSPTDFGFDMSMTFAKASGGETLEIAGSGLRIEDASHEIPDEGKVTISPSMVAKDVTVTVADPNLAAGDTYMSAFSPTAA